MVGGLCLSALWHFFFLCFSLFTVAFVWCHFLLWLNVFKSLCVCMTDLGERFSSSTTGEGQEVHDAAGQSEIAGH